MADGTDGLAVFATADDLAARTGETYDAAELSRIGVLLEDASAMLVSLGLDADASDACLLRNAKAVCCAMVQRALSAGEWDGISQRTQTAGSYSESTTFSNPDGTLYVTRPELERLGLYAGGGYRSVPAAIGWGSAEE